MTWKLVITVGIGVVVVSYGVWYLFRNGVFRKATLTHKTLGPYVCVYTHHVGPYFKVCSSMQLAFAPVEQHSNVLRRRDKKWFGVYFDNPQTVPAHRLRACVGIIVQEGKELLDEEQTGVDNHSADANSVKEFYSQLPEVQQTGLQVGVIPQFQAIAVEFPHYDPLSLVLGVRRAYKLLQGFASGSGQPGSFEVHDPANHVAIYSFLHGTRSDILPFQLRSSSQ